jgi:hypothetical protein
MTELLRDIDRRPLNFHRDYIDTVIPEHFQQEYPQFVRLLEELKDLFYIRDFESTPEQYLQELLNEALASGISKDTFPYPRLSLKLLPLLNKSKGSIASVDGFFRFLFGADVQQIYPKNDMFVVGESQIGYDSQKFIQDSFYYQIFSILLKSDVPPSKWLDIYKRYLHPAGFAIFAETFFEAVTTNTIINEMTLAILDSAANELIFVNKIENFIIGPGSDITGIDSDNQIRYPLYADPTTTFPITIQDSFGTLDSGLDSLYGTIQNLLNLNSPTFDDSGTFGTFPFIEFSNTNELMSEDEFPYFLDSGLDSA